MPFIRGRYHINPTMGEALEAAREAEAALLALEQQARAQRASGSDSDGDGESDDGTESAAPAGPGTGPVHRVEIEAAAVVPSHSGRAARGFVARVHRSGTAQSGTGSATRGALTSAPETHVFSDHRDLVNFLGDALAKE
ncbi:MAG: hypothetical protein WA434_00370 [Candidatus Acidiferrales bacterium]